MPTAAEAEAALTLVEYQAVEARREEAILALLAKYEFDAKFFKALGGNISKLSDIVAKLDELTSRSAGDAAAVRRVKQDVEEWRLALLSKEIGLALEKIDDAEFDLVKIIGSQNGRRYPASKPRAVCHPPYQRSGIQGP